VAGCCECGDEPSGSGPTYLVSLLEDVNCIHRDDRQDEVAGYCEEGIEPCGIVEGKEYIEYMRVQVLTAASMKMRESLLGCSAM
jgi:hypothetical protein